MERVKAAVLVRPEKMEIQEFHKSNIQADAMLFKIELAVYVEPMFIYIMAA